jgi:hypothetical protein
MRDGGLGEKIRTIFFDTSTEQVHNDSEKTKQVIHNANDRVNIVPTLTPDL